MPLAVDRLTPESSQQAIDTAISQSYKKCMDEGGRTMKECGGMIYGIAREKTGKSLGRKE